MMKKRIWIIAAVLLIAAVCAWAFADGPWVWTRKLTVEDIRSATVWAHVPEWVEAELSGEDMAKLVALLGDLDRDDFVENRQMGGSTPDYGMLIETADVTYRINQSIAPYGELEISRQGEDGVWWIDDDELAAFVKSVLPERTTPVPENPVTEPVKPQDPVKPERPDDSALKAAALERLRGLQPEEIVENLWNKDDPAELAALIRKAAEQPIERAEESSLFAIWDRTLKLPGNAAEGGRQESIWIGAGPEENDILQVGYSSKSNGYTTVFLEDSELYWFIRNSYGRQGVMDETAMAPYRDILDARAQKRMDERISWYGEPFCGYEIISFEQVDSFEKDGADYTVYEWDAAFLTETPSKVGWSGGMWLDSQCRVRDCLGCIYFVVRTVDGKTDSEFFWDDFYWSGREHAMREVEYVFAKRDRAQLRAANGLPIPTGAAMGLTNDDADLYSKVAAYLGMPGDDLMLPVVTVYAGYPDENGDLHKVCGILRYYYHDFCYDPQTQSATYSSLGSSGSLARITVDRWGKYTEIMETLDGADNTQRIREICGPQDLLAEWLIAGDELNAKDLPVKDPDELLARYVKAYYVDHPAIIVGAEDSQHVEDQYVMKGENGTTILVEAISGADYTENHMRAYSVSGAERTSVPLHPFSVTLESETKGEFEAQFFKAYAGQDAFVFPSAWENPMSGFAHKSEENVYLTFTDCGVWRISPDDETAEKLTADLYMGETQEDIAKGLSATSPGASLFWIDSVTLNPTGKYVVYRTNRDADDGANMSIWKIDLHSGAESRLVAPAENNDIVGFIKNHTLVIGALKETCLVNILNGDRTAVDVPDLANMRVSGVNNGIIVIHSYQDGSSVTTAHISEVNIATGNLIERTKVQGCLGGLPVFSPSGTKLAIAYGEDPMVGTKDIVIVDTETDKHIRASAIIGSDKFMKSKCLWIDDDTLLVNTR